MQRTENKRGTRSIGHRCLSIFLGLPLNFVRILPPARYIKAAGNCAAEYTVGNTHASVFLLQFALLFFTQFQVICFQTIAKKYLNVVRRRFLYSSACTIIAYLIKVR